MNQEQQNAFTAHYQQHNVYAGLRETLAQGVNLSNINAFITTLWEHGLCIAPAQPLPRPSFSVEDLDELNLDGYDRLTSPAKQVLAACVNAHQNAVEFEVPGLSFDAVLIEAAQDKRYKVLTGWTLNTLLELLMARGMVEKHHYHYRLSAPLAAVIEQASQPQTEQVA